MGPHLCRHICQTEEVLFSLEIYKRLYNGKLLTKDHHYQDGDGEWYTYIIRRKDRLKKKIQFLEGRKKRKEVENKIGNHRWFTSHKRYMWHFKTCTFLLMLIRSQRSKRLLRHIGLLTLLSETPFTLVVEGHTRTLSIKWGNTKPKETVLDFHPFTDWISQWHYYFFYYVHFGSREMVSFLGYLQSNILTLIIILIEGSRKNPPPIIQLNPFRTLSNV